MWVWIVCNSIILGEEVVIVNDESVLVFACLVRVMSEDTIFAFAWQFF